MVVRFIKTEFLDGDLIGVCTISKDDCNGHPEHRGKMVVYHPEDLKEFEGLDDVEKRILHWGYELFTETIPAEERKITMAEMRKKLKKESVT